MASTDSLYVACAGGELVTLPAAGGAPTRTVFVEPDLRDAVVVGSSLYVRELRSAAILQIAADGSIANRFARPVSDLEPGVAWRMIATPSGLAVSLQAASPAPISPTPGSYGTGGCGGAVTNPVIGTWGLDGTAGSLSTLEGVLPVDLALSPDGTTFAVVAAGEWLPPRLDAARRFTSAPASGRWAAAAASALVWDGDARERTGGGGRLRLDRSDPRPDPRARAARDRRRERLGRSSLARFSTISRDDTGHEAFHTDQGGEIACASCHCEGGDDGRTWLFRDVGLRRTPSVLGTVQGTAPYHWDGSQLDLPMLYAGSLLRMSGPSFHGRSGERVHVVARCARRARSPLRGTPPPSRAVRRSSKGREGARPATRGRGFTTNNQTVDVGTGQAFQVPPLIGVSARAPFLHDGCAPTLVSAIGACGHATTHGTTSAFTSACKLSDLATYLGKPMRRAGGCERSGRGAAWRVLFGAASALVALACGSGGVGSPFASIEPSPSSSGGGGAEAGTTVPVPCGGACCGGPCP